MFDTKLRTELEAAKIAGGALNRELEFKARTAALAEAKAIIGDISNISQNLVNKLNYKGENAKQMYLADYINAVTARNLGNKLTERQKQLIESGLSISN